MVSKWIIQKYTWIRGITFKKERMNVVYKDLFILKDKSIMLKILPSLLGHSHIVKRFASIEFYQV